MPECRVAAYALAVVAGENLAGRLVRLACARHLQDLETAAERGLRWDAAAAASTIEFFERFLCLNGGEHEGKPFVLQPWQAFLVGCLFGWKNADGYRRFRTAYVEIGKGNGKSPLVAGIGLKCLVADGEPRAEVYAAATKKDQAMILFRDAVAMVDQSPALSKRVQKSGAKGREWNLAHFKSGSFFRPIASDDGQSGPRPSCALIDEVHEHKSRLVIDMMRAGTKGRRQALILEITNSGHDRTSVCWEHHQYTEKVLEGLLADDSWFGYVCQLDPCQRHRDEGQTQPVDGCPDCDSWENEACWLKANPNLGVSVTLAYLRNQVREAQGMPASQNTVKRLNFCLWTEVACHAIPMDKWRACAREIDVAALAGRSCHAALDIGSTSDFTAFVRLFPHDDDEVVEVPAPDGTEGETVPIVRRSYTLIPHLWLPERPVKRDPYLQAVIEGWRREGWIKTTPGEVVDYDLVLADIVKLDQVTPFFDVAIDRGFQGAQFATNLQKHFGEEKVVAFAQGILSMNAPFREFLELVKLLRILHPGNPAADWMAANCAAESRGGLMKPSKDASREKIDFVTAAVMALGRAMLGGCATPTITVS